MTRLLTLLVIAGWLLSAAACDLQDKKSAKVKRLEKDRKKTLATRSSATAIHHKTPGESATPTKILIPPPPAKTVPAEAPISRPKGIRKPAGIILEADKGAYAVNRAGKKRTLQGQSAFYAGDTLHSDRRGILSAQFSDGTLIELDRKTKLVVHRYAYDPAKRTGVLDINTTGGQTNVAAGAIADIAPQQFLLRGRSKRVDQAPPVTPKPKPRSSKPRKHTRKVSTPESRRQRRWGE